MPIAPLLCGGAIWIATAGRRAALPAALLVGGVVMAWLSRRHVGGFENVLVSALAGAAAAGSCLPAAARTSAARTAIAGLVLLQVAMFVVDVRALFSPLRRPFHFNSEWLAPSPRHRLACDRIADLLRRQPGPVLDLFLGHFATLADKPRTAGPFAITDVVLPIIGLLDGRPPSARALAVAEKLNASVLAAINERRFAAILIALPHGAPFYALLTGALQGYALTPLPQDVVDGIGTGTVDYQPRQLVLFERDPHFPSPQPR